MKKGQVRYVAFDLQLNSRSVRVYANPKVAAAADELLKDMDLYRRVRLGEVLEAAYNQGHKDGAKRAFDALDHSVSAAKQSVPHRPPGKPRLF